MFIDIFEDFSGLPWDRAVEFVINLIPSTSPTSKAPYTSKARGSEGPLEWARR